MFPNLSFACSAPPLAPSHCTASQHRIYPFLICHGSLASSSSPSSLFNGSCNLAVILLRFARFDACLSVLSWQVVVLSHLVVHLLRLAAFTSFAEANQRPNSFAGAAPAQNLTVCVVRRWCACVALLPRPLRPQARVLLWRPTDGRPYRTCKGSNTVPSRVPSVASLASRAQSNVPTVPLGPLAR